MSIVNCPHGSVIENIKIYCLVQFGDFYSHINAYRYYKNIFVSNTLVRHCLLVQFRSIRIILNQTILQYFFRHVLTGHPVYVWNWE